jgi:uncharacterized hydrophobic protein (TIGR00271 family)
MEIKFFENLNDSDKTRAVEKLVKNSSPSQQFFLMVILAILMATFGLLEGNVAVIIGSMLIAPVLYPVLGLSMGLVMSDISLISRSFKTLIYSVIFGLIASIFVTIFFSSGDPFTLEIINFARPSLVSVAVAIIAGLAASFALVKSDMSETLPGVAISVALVPPLSVIGIGIAKANWGLISSATILFIVNIIGIVFASMLIFSMMNFYVKRRVAKKEIKKGDKVVDKEKIINSE